MNPLLPPLNGPGYDGRAARIFLGLLALLTIGPGLIHSYLPDGGAGVIAGLDLDGRRESVLSLFAWKGATQIAFGLGLLAVALRYAALTPLFLLLVLIERVLLSARWWIFAPTEGHRPPEHYTGFVMIPLTALFLVLALRKRRA